MTKIYTKKGDAGNSALPGGPIIPKSNPIFALLGQIDQVNASIGVLLAEDIAEYGREMLIDIQKKLMGLGSKIAKVESSQLRDQINIKDILKLENEIDEMNEELPELRNFILPGGSRKSALSHIVRSEVRTLERRLVAYKIDKPEVLQWVNRLSDFFFVLARYFNHDSEVDEIIW